MLVFYFFNIAYEADAQLAYLDSINYIDCICTVDSDLLAYGCKNVIYKLDNTGNCINIKYNDIFKLSCFKTFDNDMFLKYCILAGIYFFYLKAVIIINAMEWESRKP